MAKVIKPADSDQEVEFYPTVFLAGSIEMGKAEDWQKTIEKELEKLDVTIFNPRRDDWDSSWTQDQSNTQFNDQVNWELNKLERCDTIFMYLSPETQSPISLLELGRYIQYGKMVVCCPKGFWRKGNVDILCTRENVPVFEDLQSAIGALKTRINRQIID
jgi:hypothetical protein